MKLSFVLVKKYLKNKGKEILKFGHQKLYDFSLVTEIPKFSITFNIRPQYDIMKTLINWALNFLFRKIILLLTESRL